MTDRYDAIVVGLGAMGSATVYHLARLGVKVLGIDMFRPGHDQGSSHGYHRKIRMSQLHNDAYIPIGERTRDLWHELERESGQQLIRMTGEIQLRDVAGNSDHATHISRMKEQGYWEELDERELSACYPGFRLAEGITAVYEKTSGYVLSEAGIIAHVQLAQQLGATIAAGEEVTAWKADGSGVRVETTTSSYAADRLVITTGPWATELLSEMNFPLRVERTVNGYFQPTTPEFWSIEQGAPTFLLNVPEGNFYGIPAVDGVGLKIGRFGGRQTTPRTIDRSIDDGEIQALRDVLDRYMPGASGPETRRITCMCTYTADDGFIVGPHPEHAQVALGCGFNGRGFKFSPVIGEVLAHQASDTGYPLDVSFMSPARFLPPAGSR